MLKKKSAGTIFHLFHKEKKKSFFFKKLFFFFRFFLRNNVFLKNKINLSFSFADFLLSIPAELLDDYIMWNRGITFYFYKKSNRTNNSGMRFFNGFLRFDLLVLKKKQFIFTIFNELFPLFFLRKKRYSLAVRAFRLNQFGSDNFFYIYNNLYALSGNHRIKNVSFILNNIYNMHVKLEFKFSPVFFDYSFFSSPLTFFNNYLGFLFFKGVLRLNLIKFIYAKILQTTAYKF